MKSSSEEGGDSLGRPSKGDHMIRRQQRKIKKQLKIVDKEQPPAGHINICAAAVTAAQRSSTASRMTVKGSQDIKGVGRVGDTKPAWQQD